MQRTVSAGSAGTASSRSASQEAIRAGMSPGGRNTGSSGSITNFSGGCRAASASSEPSEDSGQPRRLSCSSQRPITLRR